MRTTGNVMGIQARLILERIDETWKVLKRSMQDEKESYLLADGGATTEENLAGEGGEADSLQRVIVASKGAVFDDHRLTTELPEPNWERRLPLQAAFITDAGTGSGHVATGSRSVPQSRTRQKKKRAGGSILLLLNSMVRPEKASTKPNEPQETRSAPAPPTLWEGPDSRYLGTRS
ncbi:hypothetical protein [Brevibacillus borstelensis]|uniref:hypothetical protein n=1 Tax=Brevibacillus borstelensis TaxID=45462 RepID=UPI0030BD12A2